MEQLKSSSKKILYQMIMTALFAGLCFGGTFINIPLPTGGKVHLGNFFCVLGSLLCGGFVGGFGGSLGMGINDIIYAYPITTILRTFVVKFVMGFLCGFLFRLLLKKEKNMKIYTGVLFGISLTVLLSFILLYFFPIQFNYQKGDSIKVYNLTTSIRDIIFVGIFALLLLVLFILSFKKKQKVQILAFSLTIGTLVNILCEVALRIIIDLSIGVTMQGAVLYALYKTPASIITGVVTITFTTSIFFPLYHATKKINYLNDLHAYLD